MDNIKKVFKSNETLFLRFVGPLLIGIIIGTILKMTNQIFIAQIFAQISDVILYFINLIVPIMVFIYTFSAIIYFKNNIFKFIIKYIVVLIITLVILGFLTTLVAYAIVPYTIVGAIGESDQMYIDPFVKMGKVSEMYILYALGLAIILGSVIKAFYSTKVEKFSVLEKYLNIFVRKILLNIFPILVISSFVVSVFSQGGATIIIMDLLLSIVVLVLQVVWLCSNYFISSLKKKSMFKKLCVTGTKVYTMVTAMAGMSSGGIVPMIIEEQEKLGFDKSKAKFISATSFNLPGSLISMIIFSYGVLCLNGINMPMYEFLVFVFVIILILVIAPAVPGGVLATVTPYLSSFLGFSDAMTSLFSGFYYRQGTSNAAVNNSADIYMASYLNEEETNAKL